jgi:hypothetical protein
VWKGKGKPRSRWLKELEEYLAFESGRKLADDSAVWFEAGVREEGWYSEPPECQEFHYWEKPAALIDPSILV